MIYTHNVSDEPLENIRMNECDAAPGLATSRFRALWNEIERLRAALDLQSREPIGKPATMESAPQAIKDFLHAVDRGYYGQMPSGFNDSAFVKALRDEVALGMCKLKEGRAADLTDKQCREIADLACTNTIWLSAFSCIRPTDELKMQLGDQVLRMLDQRENLIPARADHESNISRLTPVLYLSINKS